MANHIHIGPEDLYSNYEYKVTVKALKREFPFIKDVRINEENINKYGLIFIYIVIDPYQMAKMYNLTPNKFVLDRIMEGKKDFDIPAITPSIFVSESHSDVKPITSAIDNLITDVHNSNAIPSTMKMFRGRQLSVGGYMVDPLLVTTPIDDSTTV
jgi:hypothetical protein